MWLRSGQLMSREWDMASVNWPLVPGAREVRALRALQSNRTQKGRYEHTDLKRSEG
jgi:hypothetical protein